MKSSARNGKIDLLKFIFAVIIIIYHFNKATTYPQPIFTRGYIGVEFFFVTSGFLFAQSLSRLSCRKATLIDDSFAFMKRKFISLFPYHFFFLLATLIFCIIHYHWDTERSFVQIIKCIPDLLLLRINGISSLTLLGHEWYLSAMLIVMFILTPIALQYRSFFFRFLCPVLTVFCLGFLYQQKHNLDFVTEWVGLCTAGFLRGTGEIALGCLCYAVYDKKLPERLPKWLLSAIELFLYAVILLHANRMTTIVNDYAILFLTAIAVTISFTSKASFGFLNNRFVYFLGKLSYPIYLSQIFVRQIIAPIDFGLGYAFHVAFYVVCVIVVSLLCILLVDNLLKLTKKTSPHPLPTN